MNELPAWVQVTAVNLDVLKEVGTDGVIDSIAGSISNKEYKIDQALKKGT